MEYLFGWDFKKGRSSEEGGLLGHVRCFYGTGELTEPSDVGESPVSNFTACMLSDLIQYLFIFKA